ncbi:hypothetical protein ACFXKG_00900 [Streptomyces sp. NPDC059255]|uniref:hypothetical protein n=1 Tax=Streptomyces sp. NPDC059255 TaxID=3346793 RepID=UPI0036A0F8E3
MRELPKRFGSWRTVHERHGLWAAGGTWGGLLRHAPGSALVVTGGNGSELLDTRRG